jgi:hypothetical protein
MHQSGMQKAFSACCIPDFSLVLFDVMLSNIMTSNEKNIKRQLAH